MAAGCEQGRNRRAALATLALHAALLALLLLTPAAHRLPAPPPALLVTELPAPPPGGQEEQAGGPALLPPVLLPIAIDVPPPVISIAAPDIPATPPAGSDSAGNGSSSGTGTGTGTGAGTDAGAGAARRARRISGSIGAADFPASRALRGRSSSVTIALSIDRSGTPVRCRVLTASGDDTLDQRTCALALQRFRYRPALDSAGNPVDDVAGWRQDWWPAGTPRP